MFPMGQQEMWHVWTPADATYAQRHVDVALQRAELLPHALKCEQGPGEVVVLPHLWGHATRNLQPSIGWVSELNFDRSYDDGLAASHGGEWWRTGERGRKDSSSRPIKGGAGGGGRKRKG